MPEEGGESFRPMSIPAGPEGLKERHSDREAWFVPRALWAGTDPRCGMPDGQPKVKPENSPIRGKVTSWADGHRFGKSECSQRRVLETKDERRADRARKQGEMWAQCAYSSRSLSLRAERAACRLLEA